MSERKKGTPIEIQVLFHPSQNNPVRLKLELPETQRGTLVSNCMHEGFQFFYFNGTIKKGDIVMAAPMILPSFFTDGDLASKGKDIRSLFLLRIGATRQGKKAIADFFKDMTQHGPHGCPHLIIVREDSIDRTGKVSRSGKFSHSFFRFNDMRFYPFLLREFTVAYYVCDEHGTEYHWPAYNPKKYKGIGLVEPVVYDATLGLFVTRNVKYVKK